VSREKDTALVTLRAENRKLKAEVKRLEKLVLKANERHEEYRRERDIKEADDHYFNGSEPR